MMTTLALVAALAAQQLPRTLGAPVQQEPPRYRPVGQAAKPSKPIPADQWSYYQWAPIPDARNNVWHGLLNTPPMEHAAVMPEGTWHARLFLDYASADWTTDDGGGPGAFKAAYLMQTLAVDYNVYERLQLGVRLSAGQLGEGDDQNILVFDGSQQMVEDGDRGFGLESIVLRGRLVFPTKTGGTFGALAEIKIPMGSADDFLTGESLDIGLSGLWSQKWAKVGLTVNLGVVMPMGDLGIFTDNDEANPYFHGGASIAYQWHARFIGLAQLQFNSSAFGDIAAIDEPVATFSVGARYKLSGKLYFSGSLGAGLTEASGGAILSTGLDLVF